MEIVATTCICLNAKVNSGDSSCEGTVQTDQIMLDCRLMADCADHVLFIFPSFP